MSDNTKTGIPIGVMRRRSKSPFRTRPEVAHWDPRTPSVIVTGTPGRGKRSFPEGSGANV